MNKIISRKEILNNADEYIKTQNENLKNTPYFIDEKTAFRAIKFISLLKHTAGEFAGVNFQLLPFQIKFIIDAVATFDRSINSRRYSQALLFIPRKNGKTELLAAILLYFLFVDSEKGKEIYCAANETEQAKIVYNSTSTMLRQNPSLEKIATIFKSTKTIERNNEFRDFQGFDC